MGQSRREELSLNEGITSFRRFAFISTAATYIVIFMGGLVRVAGAGLGCPDWPKCFGRWFPPLNASQLPPDIDPALFNFTLAWIEYFNRFAGAATGILILITAVLAVMHCRSRPKILYASIAALLLVAFQGWYGGQVVQSELLPVTVTLHMILAFLLVSILIYVTQQAYYHENPTADKEAVYPHNTDKWLRGLGAATIAQIILGTQIRSSIEVLRERFPLQSEGEWLDMVGAVQNVHWILGVIMFFISVHTGAKLLKFGKNLPLLVKQGAWAMMTLILVQLIMGLVLVTADLPELAQLFHLWVASLFFGMIVILVTALGRQRGD